jgi:hypothetical protein
LRQEIGDGRLETRDGRLENWAGNKRQEAEDRRMNIGDLGEETDDGENRQETASFLYKF